MRTARARISGEWRFDVHDPGAEGRTVGSRTGDRYFRRILLTVVIGHSFAFGRCDQQIFQRQFQLLDLAFDLFRGLAEDVFLQLAMAKSV